MNVKDYVLLSPEEADGTKSSKKLLAKVMSVGQDSLSFQARLENFPHLNPQVLNFEKKHVFLNLGPDPQLGSVYGVSVRNLFVKTLESPAIGPVHFFCQPSKENFASLKTALPNFVSMLAKHRMTFLLEENISLEIVSKASSRDAGMFIFYKKRDRPSRIQLTIDSDRLTSLGADSLEYVLAHEFGHALHYHFFQDQPEIIASWIKLYSSCTSALPFSLKKSRGFLRDAVKLGSLRALKKSFDKDEDLLSELGQVLRWIRSLRGIPPRDLDLLLSNGEVDALKEIWPMTDLAVGHKSVLVTQYACRNYRELFAEAFAFKITGKRLTKEVDALLSRTMSSITLKQGS